MVHLSAPRASPNDELAQKRRVISGVFDARRTSMLRHVAHESGFTVLLTHKRFYSIDWGMTRWQDFNAPVSQVMSVAARMLNMLNMQHAGG
jgi:hypothetical protein